MHSLQKGGNLGNITTSSRQRPFFRLELGNLVALRFDGYLEALCVFVFEDEQVLSTGFVRRKWDERQLLYVGKVTAAQVRGWATDGNNANDQREKESRSIL